MKSGRVLQVAKPDELARKPADPYVARLLALTIGGGDTVRA
jgi:ABC-type proline/glycine betaine transport system ATPase subunit